VRSVASEVAAAACSKVRRRIMPCRAAAGR
jgi:hypothetical protein